ncbi:hypothetical protein J2W32_000977 [Variovorax boronicumulans]|uniref:Uncharacterized protein n=1 Tax=Variovorax boronicumulans TaxID=436515 RepID=A0AAW8CXE3_9BURK|nr:hypothetical protein [Variovorax boronicumulans]MDP9892579.1 hypothetical protein [Variovorax boronicumulans]MDQ0051941.1 hypothetical protein [Variovorax boronicumulans]
MKNIDDLRALLFQELEVLQASPSDADVDRIRLKCALVDRVIDITRLEVQLAAVMKGALDVPFIEAQASERDNGARHPSSFAANEEEAPKVAALTPLERAARVLAGGPKADHRWRASLRRD